MFFRYELVDSGPTQWTPVKSLERFRKTVNGNHTSYSDEVELDDDHSNLPLSSLVRIYPRGGVIVPSESVDMVSDILEFHTKFEIEYKGKPRFLPDDISKFRIDFLNEEFTEYVDSVNSEDLHDQLDALVDLVYVTLGAAHLHGFDFNEAWRRVHSANMSKVLAQSSEESKRGYSKDVVKPEGWTAPDLSDLVFTE